MQETIALDAALTLCGGGCILLALLVIVSALVRRVIRPHVIVTAKMRKNEQRRSANLFAR